MPIDTSELRRTGADQGGIAGGMLRAAAIEIEQLRDVLRMYRKLPVGGYGQLLGSGKADEAADRLLGVSDE